ncbi:MAG TPA: hypothetical protein VLF69_04235 [Candidatus Saccharimonadales bacterium]|nr:hypothetical protein [Candidatus Saccharimonadales bacterium]
MPPEDRYYTYNSLTNSDKELLLSHGYRPGELQPDELKELLEDLRAQVGGDEDSDRLSIDVVADERDGTE